MINQKKGFTLIEFLVVIAIIGILSSVVVASLNTARLKARDAKRIADIKQIQLALEMYNDKNGSYPTALSALTTAGFISVVPTDPSAGAAYSFGYNPSTSPTTYHLGATLEDSSNPALSSDRDCVSSANPPTNCPATTTYTGGFDGADPVYDVTP
jgi:type II secretion system protein G